MPKRLTFLHLFKIPFRSLALHALCWLLYITFELAVLYVHDIPFSPWSNYVLYYTINIALFYSHLRVLNYTFGIKSRNRIITGAFILALQLLIFMILKTCIDMLTNPGAGSIAFKFQAAERFYAANIFRALTFCMLATFYWVAGNIAGYRRAALEAERLELLAWKSNAELEKGLIQARNAYLQQQINPHLLFNALSFIYSSVYRHSDQGSRCVLLLSELMRYSLEETGPDDKKPLEAEIAQVQNLIAINAYRFDQKLALETSFTGPFENFRIIPLLLITLTENLFKHGGLHDKNFPGTLLIYLTPEGLLTFQTANRKKRVAAARPSGIGLQNSRIRLADTYQSAHELKIIEDDEFFNLKLTIQL